MHVSEEIRGSLSEMLKGKRIVLGITGSIAAVECVKLARELIRHGAEVYPVMTGEACKIIGPYSMHFATGNRPVTELTGGVEHVSMCGDTMDRADLLMIAPCTANTLGKMVCGIDDTTVTTFATTAIGTGIPVMVVPAMHGTMYDHPQVRKNLERARKMGIEIVGPVREEKKAKMAGQDQILDTAVRLMEGKRRGGMLIVAGATVERMDDMRVLTNNATGKSGVYLSREAYRRGYDVLLLAGSRMCAVPEHIETIRFSSTADLLKKVEELEQKAPDVAVFSAAVSDYTMEGKPGKVPSDEEVMELKLMRTPKVIERFRSIYTSTFLVGYKAESEKDRSELLKRAFNRMKEVGMDLIIANDLSDVTEESSKILMITPEKQAFEVEGKKSDIARFIIDKVIEFSDVLR